MNITASLLVHAKSCDQAWPIKSNGGNDAEPICTKKAVIPLDSVKNFIIIFIINKFHFLKFMKIKLKVIQQLPKLFQKKNAIFNLQKCLKIDISLLTPWKRT